ncbi:MAG TPA: hypothetical protein VIY73_07710 [Polyangiaceae bacterium]
MRSFVILAPGAKRMIEWPHIANLPRAVEARLERLRATRAIQEIEAEEEHWLVDGLPWQDATPVTLILRNESYEPVEVVIELDGTWRRSPLQEVPRFGSKPARASS